MSTCAPRWLTLAGLLFLGLARLHGDPIPAGPANGVSPAQIKQWIEQLGDDHFRVRERATQGKKPPSSR